MDGRGERAVMGLGRVGLGLIVVYSLGYAVWQVLLALPLTSAWWPLVLSNVFGLWAYAPLPLMAVLALMLRRRAGWLVLLAPLAGFGIEYGALFLPSSPTVRAATTEPLRVMTWNMWVGRDRDDVLAQAAREVVPDILALQEVDHGFEKNMDALSDAWPYQVRGTARGRERLALLSRWPILEHEVDGRWLGCHCMQAVILWHGERIRVINTHVWAPYYHLDDGLQPVRRFDTQHQDVAFVHLAEAVAQSREPVILVGDLNTTSRQPNFERLLGSGLVDAHVTGGWGFGLTFPAPNSTVDWLPFSLLRIDHVLVEPEWQVQAIATHPLSGSDHQAVWSDLTLEGR